MEQNKVSVFSYRFWKDKVIFIYCFLASFFLTLFGYPPKAQFGYSGGSFESRSGGSGNDKGNHHGWGGGGYKELKDIGPCFGGG